MYIDIYIYRYLIVVGEQQNCKHHLLKCHHFNEEVQQEVDAVVEVAVVINISIENNEITLMVEIKNIKIKNLFLFHSGHQEGTGGWSGRGGGGSGGDRPYSGGYQQQQQYGMIDPYAQQYSQMGYQGQQQVVNEYVGMDNGGGYGGRGRGRGGRGGRGSRRPY
jgi:hypothetical protein